MHKMVAYDEYVQEGEIRRSHRLILKQGQRQLGPPDPTTKAKLLAIQNLNR